MTGSMPGLAPGICILKVFNQIPSNSIKTGIGKSKVHLTIRPGCTTDSVVVEYCRNQLIPFKSVLWCSLINCSIFTAVKQNISFFRNLYSFCKNCLKVIYVYSSIRRESSKSGTNLANLFRSLSNIISKFRLEREADAGNRQ